MAPIGILSIKMALRDYIPRTAEHLTNRIATHLSEKEKTAGLAYMNYKPELIKLQTGDAMYTHGQVKGELGVVLLSYLVTKDRGGLICVAK